MPFDSPRGRPRISQVQSVPAPVGGLNLRDSAAAMPVTDALRMLNFFPLPYAVSIRKGWRQWGGPYPASIGTIANHSIDSSVTGNHILVAAGFNLYAQVFANDPVPTPGVTGQNSNHWLHTMISNSGGNFTYLVNGIDKPQVYQGTSGAVPTSTWTTVNQSFVTPPDFPPGFDVAGIDPAKFSNVTLHQRRLWFTERDSLRGWYLPPDSLGGYAHEWDFGPVMAMGGNLVAIMSWTIDAGQGMDDYLAAISSEGQIAVYTGTDPDIPTTWSLSGVFNIGSPVGDRCWCKYGGEVLVITTDGLLPLSKALQSTRVNTNIALTDKIQHLISALVSEFGALSGWQPFLFPGENQVWLMAAAAQGVIRIFSMNTITGAWCEFDSMDVRDICLLNDFPLFGTGDGMLGLAWQGYLDDVDPVTTLGDYISAEVLTAYNYFNETGRNKRWVMARLIFQAGNVPSAAIGMSTDFALIDSPGSVGPPSAPTATPFWGIAEWGVDVWPPTETRYREWITVNGIGYCAALNLRVRQGSPLLWTASDMVYEIGSII